MRQFDFFQNVFRPSSNIFIFWSQKIKQRYIFGFQYFAPVFQKTLLFLESVSILIIDYLVIKMFEYPLGTDIPLVKLLWPSSCFKSIYKKNCTMSEYKEFLWKSHREIWKFQYYFNWCFKQLLHPELHHKLKWLLL